MAMTPKIITSSTPLAAGAMVLALAATVWFVAEYAPGANLVQPDEIVLEPTAPPTLSTAPHAALDVPFSPGERPQSPAHCAELADDLFEVFEPLAAGQGVEVRTKVLATLVAEYIGANCPNAIHEGDWSTTSQILGVGLLYEALEPQSEVYDASVVWDPRAAHLVEVAVSTFGVLSPVSMCDEALRQPEMGENAFTPLIEPCLAAF